MIALIICPLIYLFGFFMTPFFANLFYDTKMETGRTDRFNRRLPDIKAFYHDGKKSFESDELNFMCFVWPIVWLIFTVQFVYSASGDLGTVLRTKVMSNDKYKPEREHKG